MNLFEKAKANATTGSKKKTEKVIVKVEDVQFDKDLKRYAELKAELDAIQAKLDMVEADFKPACIGVFNEQYKKNGAYPESFIATSVSGHQVMVVPTDRYIKPTDETFAELNEKYNGEITETVDEYTLDKDLVNEYGNKIAAAIEKAKDIPREVKDNLIKVKSIITVKKGSITKAFTVGKGNISEYISDIRPVFQLKNPKISDPKVSE